MDEQEKLKEFSVRVHQTGDWQIFWTVLIVLWCAGIAAGKTTPEKLVALIPPYGVYKGVELFLTKLGFLT